jgi:hypothetical protein
MAEQVVRCMQRMASDGHTIIATIHQPSSQVFAMFNE